MNENSIIEITLLLYFCKIYALKITAKSPEIKLLSYFSIYFYYPNFYDIINRM